MLKDNNKVKYINSVVEYIENNLSYDINADILTRFGYISRSQLYRDFYNVTGHSVKEYIRKRRLSNALTLIKKSHFNLADIAYHCGYSSQQALCRCVNQSIGMKPLEYKRNEYYYFFPPFRGHTANDVTVSNCTIPETMCLKYYSSSPDNIEDLAISYFFTLVPDYKGRLFGKSGQIKGTKYCYELYISEFIDYIQILNNSEFVLKGKIDSSTYLYAVSNAKYIKEQINFAWDYLYTTWLTDSMFECSGKDYFEEYIIRNQKPVRLRLFLPIRRQAGYPKISIVKNPDMHFIISTANGYNAEKTASNTVLKFLSDFSPIILKSLNEFYIKKDINSYTCGVKVNKLINIPENTPVKTLSINEGTYIVLSGNTLGDYDRYEDLLALFAEYNGLSIDSSNIFATYHTNGNFKNPKSTMYCKMNLGTK